jgi:hypothetical protein
MSPPNTDLLLVGELDRAGRKRGELLGQVAGAATAWMAIIERPVNDA